ncbi:MAG: glycosyltransferase [Nanoarchaeota archaeon]
MEKIKVLIRTEGHLKLGMGNIFRSIRIAKKLQEKYKAEIRFILEPTSHIGIKKILDAGFRVEIVEFSKINQYLKHIKKFNPNLIINDVLNLEEGYMKELKKLGLLVVNFEDKEFSVTREYANIVFNSLYHDKDTKVGYYHGPKYAPLKNSFKNMKKKKIDKECKNFLLAFGGSDPSGFTIKVAKVLNKINNIHATIFLGPSFGNHQQLYDLLKYLDKDKFTIKYDVEYNAEDFGRADIAIASGGHTSFELASAGIPAILLCQNNLERDRAKIIEKYGAIINLGDGNKLTDLDLINNIKKLMNNYEMRKKMSEKGQKLVDGYGVDRIAEIIIKSLNNKDLKI